MDPAPCWNRLQNMHRQSAFYEAVLEFGAGSNGSLTTTQGISTLLFVNVDQEKLKMGKDDETRDRNY